jgi:hypothetical protein
MSIRSKRAKRFRANQMTLSIESVVNRSVRGEKSLGGSLGLKPLHFPLSSSDREMRILRPLVFSKSARPVPILKAKLGQGRNIGSKPVGDHHLGFHFLAPDQSLQKLQRRRGVATMLDNHVEHFALVVHTPPQIHATTADVHHHLVQMPPSGWRWPPPP